MNLILIISDTLRRDHLGCYGNDWISTPNIDRFAARSLVFDRAYSGSFPTVPNRRDVLTGRYTATYTDWAPLSSEEVVLPAVLGSNGYTSMMVCDCPHVLENGYHYDRGFDGFEWIRGQETDRWRTAPDGAPYPCDPAKVRGADRMQQQHRRNIAPWQHEADRFVARTMSAASDWLEDNYRRGPFFLYVDTFDPHEPWDAPQWYVEMYDPGYAGEVVDYPRYWYTDFLTPAELKHCRALYAAEVTLVDRWVGRLLDKAQDLGLLEDSVVVLTTDHGFLHGEHGIMGKSLIRESGGLSYIPLYEEINHIPLIVSYPGARAGRTDALVQPLDLMPTLLECAGVEIPDTVQGRSYAAVLRGECEQHRACAVSSPYLGGARVPVTVVRDGYAAVLYAAEEGVSGGPDLAVDGIAKKQAHEGDAVDLLFDIASAPDQQVSIAQQHPDLMAALRADLLAYLAEAGAPESLIARWRRRHA